MRGTSYFTPMVMLPFETIWAIAEPAGNVFAPEDELAEDEDADDDEEDDDDDAALLLELLLELPPHAPARNIAIAATPTTVYFNDFKTAPLSTLPLTTA